MKLHAEPDLSICNETYNKATTTNRARDNHLHCARMFQAR